MVNSGYLDIEEVQTGSLAQKAGILAGDRLISINRHKISDAIDLMFYANEPHLDVVVRRDKENIAFSISKNDNEVNNLGIVPKPFKIKTCRNNCIFCFVSQLPKGLRKSLYIKDEDYRLSFLYGSYITMTNLSDADRKRIVEQHLSPLYISVHSTDTAIRNKMLGNARAGDILKEIKFLADNRLKMHTQIVLCPGYNDGKNLTKTINDLYRFYPYVMSIAVVPVGLTSHRKKPVKPVEREDAIHAIEIINRFQTRFKRKHGEHIVYAADELYIKAGITFPYLEHYGELPQIENGVGMVPLFVHQSKRLKIPQSHLYDFRAQGKRFVVFTGISFYPYLWRFIERIKRYGVDIEAVEIGNTFFGSSVTVTGLLTGRDIMKSLTGVVKSGDILLIPDVVMKEGVEVFLDNVSRQDVEDILGVKAVVIESAPEGLVNAILALSK
jgi:putative radical SAM enzyme (TIGR03279 family)